MAHMNKLLILISAGAVALFSSCSTPKSKSGSFGYYPKALKANNPSNVEIKVSTGARAVYVVEGDKVLLASRAGVGRAGSPTPSGNSKVGRKYAGKRRISNPGAGYPMPYWVEFAGKPAYGFHWGFVKPEPCSMGCVRLPWHVAPQFFDLVKVGTPINVSTSQKWDKTVGAKLPVLDDGPLPNPPSSYMNSSQVFSDIKNHRVPPVYRR